MNLKNKSATKTADGIAEITRRSARTAAKNAGKSAMKSAKASATKSTRQVVRAAARDQDPTTFRRAGGAVAIGVVAGLAGLAYYVFAVKTPREREAAKDATLNLTDDLRDSASEGVRHAVNRVNGTARVTQASVADGLTQAAETAAVVASKAGKKTDEVGSTVENAAETVADQKKSRG